MGGKEIFALSLCCVYIFSLIRVIFLFFLIFIISLFDVLPYSHQINKSFFHISYFSSFV